MSQPTPSPSLLTLMNTFLKSAEERKEGTNLDLAGDAKSKHPSADAPDGTRPASEGARSAENESDVRQDVPNTINDPGTRNPAGGSKKPTDTQGTVSMSSDESAAGNVDTPKNQHSMASDPATGPGMEGRNDKAAGDDVAAVIKLGNELAAQIALLTKKSGEGDEAPVGGAADVGQQQQDAGQAAAQAPAPEAQQATPEGDAGDKQAAEKEWALFKAAAEKYPEDVEAGYVSAALLAQQLGLAKEAAADDAQLAGFVAAIQKQAAADAEGYVQFLEGYKESIEKHAQPAMDPAALASLGNAEEGEAALGAEEGGEEGGEGAEGVGDEEVLEAVAEALDEAGISPEELAQAVAEAEGGGAEEGAEGAEGVAGAEGGGLPAGLEAAAAAGAGTVKSAGNSPLKAVIRDYFSK